ncbi:hypothetical protein V499_01493 [Pseudogymnoascus sp. VKM F-103]|nr:hypothetical protein V499_01493 [Pseudogymnoascus sp. VKM F-103]
MIRVGRPCLTCTPQRSCWVERPTNKNKRTHVVAIFTDEWNRSFNRKNDRKRRRRFLESDEKVSGFTAVFCQDWKDGDSDEDFEPSDTDDFPKPLASAWPRCEYEGYYSPFSAATTSSYTSPTRHIYPFRGSAPPTPTAAETLDSPLIMSTDDEETIAEGYEHLEYQAKSPPEIMNPMTPNNIPTTDKEGMVPFREEIVDHHWLSWNEKRIREGGGFDYWSSFIECNIIAGGNHELDGCQGAGTTPEKSLEHSFDEFIN